MYRNVRIMWSITVMMIICFSLSTAWAQSSEVRLVSEEQAAERPVALVNGEAILHETLEGEVAKVREMSKMQGQQLDPSRNNDLKRDILERLINYELLWQKSLALGVEAPDQAVADELEKLKSQFPDEKTFRETMAGMGMTQAELKSRIRKNIAVRALLEQEVLSKISITPDEREAFYKDNTHYFEEPEQVKASHIFIAAQKDASEADKKQAKDTIEVLEQRLADGEKFADLAREASQCPSSENGGDLGFFARGNMDKAFESAAFAMSPDEVSSIVESSFGYHIIKVTDRKPAGVVPFADAKDDIDQYLKKQKTNKQIEEYVSGLREEADIKRYL